MTKNPPYLSKGLGWEGKNNLNDSSKANEGKGQLVKYARAYLSVNPPLTSVFYGCLTDGKLWQFVKIQFILEDINNLKVKFELLAKKKNLKITMKRIRIGISHQFLMKVS